MLTKSNNIITFIITGPLTGISKIINKNYIKQKIKEIYVMGGSIYSDYEELIFLVDADAVKTLLKSRLKIILVTHDVTKNFPANEKI